MTRMCAKFIPKLLTIEQKRLRFEVAQDNLEMVADDDNVLKKIITGEKSWIYGYDPETKTTVFTVKASTRTTAEKSTSKSEQCRVHVDCFLRF